MVEERAHPASTAPVPPVSQYGVAAPAMQFIREGLKRKKKKKKRKKKKFNNSNNEPTIVSRKTTATNMVKTMFPMQLHIHLSDCRN